MTETRTYERLTGIHAFNGFKSLRIGQRYTSVPQEEYRAGGANEGGCDGE